MLFVPTYSRSIPIIFSLTFHSWTNLTIHNFVNISKTSRYVQWDLNNEIHQWENLQSLVDTCQTRQQHYQFMDRSHTSTILLYNPSFSNITVFSTGFACHFSLIGKSIQYGTKLPGFISCGVFPRTFRKLKVQEDQLQLSLQLP